MANPKKKAYNLPQPSKNLNGPIKGHVALKSGPFATTCTRLSSQGIVQDQLNTHYKKLNKATSCIDASPPKSMALSVKKRDQMRREAMLKSMKESGSPSSRPSSRASPRPDSARQRPHSRQGLDQSFTSAELNHLATDGRLSPSPYGQPPATARSQTGGPRPRPNSRLSETGRNAAATKSLRFKETDGPRLTQSGRLRSARLEQARPASGDVLDTMAGRFTAPVRPHTPRTLQTAAQSRLAQSKSYNKPRSAKAVAAARQNGLSVPGQETDEYEQTMEEYENRLLEDDYDEDEEEGDEDKRNADHARWVEEQAKRVESLRLTGGKEENGVETDGNQEGNLTQTFQRPYYSTGSLSNRPASRVTKRMKDEEEELRYLEFVTDVTNDVLNRGIFTNSVLKQVFDSHINRNKERLDEGRMRHLMAQLQTDLFIPNSEEEEEEVAAGIAESGLDATR